MDRWQPLLDALGQLKDGWPGSAWEWDRRFLAIASSFASEVEPAARACATRAFPRGWTTKSLELAPPALRALADTTGGLRAGQRLLAGSETTASSLFGLWWPWSGGAKITLRIGILDVGVDDDPLPRVRELYGVKL